VLPNQRRSQSDHLWRRPADQDRRRDRCRAQRRADRPGGDEGCAKAGLGKIRARLVKEPRRILCVADRRHLVDGNGALASPSEPHAWPADRPRREFPLRPEVLHHSARQSAFHTRHRFAPAGRAQASAKTSVSEKSWQLPLNESGTLSSETEIEATRFAGFLPAAQLTGAGGMRYTLVQSGCKSVKARSIQLSSFRASASVAAVFRCVGEQPAAAEHQPGGRVVRDGRAAERPLRPATGLVAGGAPPPWWRIRRWRRASR
jgi:hypothetical protein